MGIGPGSIRIFNELESVAFGVAGYTNLPKGEVGPILTRPSRANSLQYGGVRLQLRGNRLSFRGNGLQLLGMQLSFGGNARVFGGAQRRFGELKCVWCEKRFEEIAV
jgi:hypothetical protein